MSKSNTLESEQLTDAMYYILLALLEERHGYAIMKFVEQLSNGYVTIGPGTLYTLLKKLCKVNWIQQTSMDEERTKTYKIGKAGIEVLCQEVKRRRHMVEDGLTLLKEIGYEI